MKRKGSIKFFLKSQNSQIQKEHKMTIPIKTITLNEHKMSNPNIELGPMWLTHRVISDRVHRLLVTLSYFRPDRFVQLLSLIPILILLLYFLVSGCLTSLC